MNSGGNGTGKFINGFFWGALIGAGVVFLLGTKKGKQILKVISEEGLELSQLFSNEGSDFQEECECDEKCEECAKEAVHSKHVQNNQEEAHGEKVHEGIVQEPAEQKQTNGHTSPRRFFRGIKRK